MGAIDSSLPSVPANATMFDQIKQVLEPLIAQRWAKGLVRYSVWISGFFWFFVALVALFNALYYLAEWWRDDLYVTVSVKGSDLLAVTRPSLLKSTSDPYSIYLALQGSFTLTPTATTVVTTTAGAATTSTMAVTPTAPAAVATSTSAAMATAGVTPTILVELGGAQGAVLLPGQPTSFRYTPGRAETWELKLFASDSSGSLSALFPTSATLTATVMLPGSSTTETATITLPKEDVFVRFFRQVFLLENINVVLVVIGVSLFLITELLKERDGARRREARVAADRLAADLLAGPADEAETLRQLVKLTQDYDEELYQGDKEWIARLNKKHAEWSEALAEAKQQPANPDRLKRLTALAAGWKATLEDEATEFARSAERAEAAKPWVGVHLVDSIRTLRRSNRGLLKLEQELNQLVSWAEGHQQLLAPQASRAVEQEKRLYDTESLPLREAIFIEQAPPGLDLYLPAELRQGLSKLGADGRRLKPVEVSSLAIVRGQQGSGRTTILRYLASNPPRFLDWLDAERASIYVAVPAAQRIDEVLVAVEQALLGKVIRALSIYPSLWEDTSPAHHELLQRFTRTPSAGLGPAGPDVRALPLLSELLRELFCRAIVICVDDLAPSIPSDLLLGALALELRSQEYVLLRVAHAAVPHDLSYPQDGRQECVQLYLTWDQAKLGELMKDLVSKLSAQEPAGPRQIHDSEELHHRLIDTGLVANPGDLLPWVRIFQEQPYNSMDKEGAEWARTWPAIVDAMQRARWQRDPNAAGWLVEDWERARASLRR